MQGRGRPFHSETVPATATVTVPAPAPESSRVELSLRRSGRWRIELAVCLGDVVYAKLFQRPILVLNSLRAAQDLLEKKSNKYSDRPRLILLTEL